MTQHTDEDDPEFRKMLDDSEKVVDCLAGGPAPAVVVLNRDAAVAIILAVIATLERPGVGLALASMLREGFLEREDDGD